MGNSPHDIFIIFAIKSGAACGHARKYLCKINMAIVKTNLTLKHKYK